MGIKRFFATKNNTITNAYKADLSTRATGSNMGASDILEVFHIYGQASTASAAPGVRVTAHELSRVLIEFPVLTELSASRDDEILPASGNVDFYLRLFDASHTETTPTNVTIVAAAVTKDWTQGTGLDTTTYKDNGASNWVKASDSVFWAVSGGDYATGSGGQSPDLTDNLYVQSQYFTSGIENLNIKVTDLVESWLNKTTDHYGFGVFLSGSHESGSTSQYTKKFFASGTEYFFNRPVLEARWDGSRQDDFSNFFLSSSRATAADNLNTIYFYNYIRGQLTNLPKPDTSDGANKYITGSAPIYVSLYSGSKDNARIGQLDLSPTGGLNLPPGSGVKNSGDTAITGGWVAKGIYSASFAYASSSITTIFPVWHTGSKQYFTGSGIQLKTFDGGNAFPTKDYVINITNLKPIYTTDETAHFRLYTRPKGWNPTIYTKAVTSIETNIIEKAYWKLVRTVDDRAVIDYGKGSDNEAYSLMSYDASGNYFDLDMSMLESGYSYQLRFLFNIAGDSKEQRTSFKFRVENGN